jgi:membrane protein insertase Oxa1/YidC/SpoIIIJ
VNPLAPFVPLIVQIPVVVSLYYVMRADARNGLFGDTGFLFIHLSARPHGLVLLALVVAYVVAQAASSLIATRRLRTGQRGLSSPSLS